MNEKLVIAEIGHNHGGDMILAKELISAAAECGVNYVKFQLYDVDKIKKPSDNTYGELKKAQLSKLDMVDLWKYTYCKTRARFMCSVFDMERLEWYMSIVPSVHKLASRSIMDNELIETMQKTGKPIIASLGMWDSLTLPEFDADFLFCLTRREVLVNGVHDLPVKYEDKLKGFSDHTVGVEYALNAIDRGATIIEKHFTFNKNWAGWDQPSSATPNEMREIVQRMKM